MQRLARTIARFLELGPDREVALAVGEELKAALASLISASGAHLADEGAVTQAGLVEVAGLPSPLVPAAVREAITRVLPGGTVVVVVAGASGNPQAIAQKFGPSFDLERVHAEFEGETLILRGTRRRQPSRERIKDLKGIAHGLEANVLIGMDGLSEGLVASAREALARHGLIKAKMTPRARLDKDDMAVELAWAIGGQVVQRVGKTAVIYRPDVPLAPPGAR